METIKKSVEIQAPIERVFAYLEDPRNGPEWLPSLVDVRNVSGSGPDVQYEWTYKMAGIKLDGKGRAIEHVPNERMVAKTQGGTDGTWTYVLQPTSTGTRFDLEVQYEVPVPVLGKLAEKLVVRRNERELETAVQNVKDHCEL